MMGQSLSIPPPSWKSSERSPRGSNLSNLNGSMILPPEILDGILEHVPTSPMSGQSTLIACALVATWWTGPSQRRLSPSVLINTSNYQRWMNGVVSSRSKAQLLEHVRWLSLNQLQMRGLSQDHGQYLPALCNVRGLKLFSAEVKHISEAQFQPCFSGFRGTLTYPFIDYIFASFGAFVALVDYFPNLRTLELRMYGLGRDEGPVPPFSRPPRGRLHVHPSSGDPSELLSRFAKLDLEYEVLVIEPLTSRYLDRPRFLESALQISPNTVKYLTMTDELQTKAETTLRSFRQLRELELKVFWLEFPKKVLLSSITSTELRKITFIAEYAAKGVFARKIEGWDLIDAHLCSLVDRLRAVGYHHTLEVELRLMKTGDFPGKLGFSRLLPAFREEGVVTITDAALGGRAVHCSTYDC